MPSPHSSVRLGHIPRDDKGKIGCTGKLPSHRYKALTPAAGKGDSLDLTLFSPEPQTLPAREGNSGFSLTWASEGPLWVTPPISKEACVQDHHPRDGPRDKPTELRVEDPQGSINPRRKFRPPPTLADLRTRTRIATIENPNASVSQSLNRSRDVMRLPPEPDIISSDSTNSVREQLRQVNQRLDEVQRDFIRSKEEVGETNKGGSPFAPEILDKPIPPVSDYRLWSPTTGALTRQSTSQLRQGVRAQLHSKFLPKADGRLTAWPHARKRRATRPIRQQILGGGPEDARHSPYYGNPRITHGTSVLTVLLIVDRETPVHSARDVATGEPVCSRRVISGREAGSRKITRNPEVTSLKDNLSGHPEENTGRSYQPLGLSRSCSIQPELRRYCRFHRDYGHDTEECNDLKNQIEDLIRQGHLHRFVRDRRASEERPRRDRNPSPRPYRPIEKQIDVIIDRPASGGNSSSARKAYARNAVEKRPRRSQDPGITFGEGDDAYPNHDDALKLGLTDKDFLPVVTTLTGFTGFPQLEQPSSQSPSGKSQD
ncbi:hypothetical protein BHE74_00035593 [Ensete ventricosum]|nr:hypothetical protein BHE74_00035593 [Ensete ventricosum]